jgi:uncharacterized protein (DUF736 family)
MAQIGTFRRSDDGSFVGVVRALRGRFRIRVKSGHKAADGTARMRLVISPTTPRLALPAIFF